MDLRFNKRVLLTGAGYSKNFGGFLAKSFRNHLLSEWRLVNDPTGMAWSMIREDKATFETVLAELRKRADAPGARPEESMSYRVMEDSVGAVFDYMRRSIEQSKDRLTFSVRRLNQFLSKFGQPSAEVGYIFTLNQDTVLEDRFNQFFGWLPPTLPGIQPSRECFTAGSTYEEYLPPVFVDEASPFGPIPKPGHLNIIKLHGSQDWISTEHQRLLIVGGEKRQAIERSALLSAYYRTFQEVLYQPEVRLFVIGYSFGDEHINEIIRNAQADYGLVLWIMDSCPYEDMIGRLPCHRNAVCGYIDEPWSEIFAKSDSETAPFDQRIHKFFY